MPRFFSVARTLMAIIPGVTLSSVALARQQKRQRELTSPPEITIRAAKLQDLTAIADITKTTFKQTFYHRETLKPCFSDAELNQIAEHLVQDCAKNLENPNHILLVADQNNQVIGYAKVSVNQQRAFLEKLYVLPEHQGKQVGGYLLLNVMQKVIQDHSKDSVMHLEVWQENLNAIRYYFNNGFLKTNKMHCKTNAAGESFFGFEMVNANLVASVQKLNEHLEKSALVQISPRK